MPLLSICVPSNRNLEQSRRTIESVYAMSKLPGVEVIVSDNSECSDKSMEFGGLDSNEFRYLVSGHSSAVKNFKNVLNNARGAYATCLSDDDLLIAMPGFDAEKIKLPGNAVGFRPNMVMFNERSGICQYTNFEIVENRAVGRVKKYFDVFAGSNTTIFSPFRREVMTDFFAEFDEFHPTRGGYADWSLTLGLLSSGILPKNDHLLYMYNNANWDSQADVSRGIGNAFQSAGLPADAAQILPVLNGVDSFAAICRRGSPVETDEKLEAAYYVLIRYFSEFANNVLKVPEARLGGNPKLDLVVKVISDVATPVDALAASLLIIDAWLPGYADKYQEYFGKIFDKEMLGRLYG